MWLNQYQNALAKTNHGGQTLYDHTIQCVEAGIRIAQLSPEYSKTQLDVLLFSLCIHDVGKLDKDFQALLRAKVDGRPLPTRKVKHESQSVVPENIRLINDNLPEILSEFKAVFGKEINLNSLTLDNMEWAWAYAVAHHGIYYLSYEQDASGNLHRTARRQWTSFTPLEYQRLTLVDLLIHFHPLGGLVIMADLMASYAFENQRDLAHVFDGVTKLPHVFGRLLNWSQELESGIQAYDPRDYHLKELLTLLANGIR
jgi:hypothetical protein